MRGDIYINVPATFINVNIKEMLLYIGFKNVRVDTNFNLVHALYQQHR